MTDHAESWIALPFPRCSAALEKERFVAGLRVLCETQNQAEELGLVEIPSECETSTAAALSVLGDLVAQGWRLRAADGAALVAPPGTQSEPDLEKQRIRRMELWKRDEQLRKPSVRRFIRRMESPRRHSGSFVSIFDLMRDGVELANCLENLREAGDLDVDKLRGYIDPYIEFVDSTTRCSFTGLRLMDIWRYFRHTWVTQYSSNPGRTMMLLIRDRASARHPVIGIAALTSPVVQLSMRDRWIGWDPKQFLSSLDRDPSAEIAEWLWLSLDSTLDAIYLDDLIADGLYWPALWRNPEPKAIQELRREAEVRRASHARFVRSSEHKKSPVGDVDWTERARTDLFRSKRCSVLADLLAARSALLPYFSDGTDTDHLTSALADSKARKAILSIVRRAKGESVGTEMANLAVCGAVPPYNPILGGKLVAMLAVTPTVIREYHKKYESCASVIASSMAGRPIARQSSLAYVGTTSLYGCGSSQYNRIRIPKEVSPTAVEEIRFEELGRSRSYGTSHLSTRSMQMLVSLAEQQENGRRINSIFGEGVNPKLRKARQGLDALGWPSDELLRHRRERIIYGVSLVTNLLRYLLGIDEEPDYRCPISNLEDTREISDYWMRRWLAGRITRGDFLEQVARHSLTRPVQHGARVVLPEAEIGHEEANWLFPDMDS